MKNRWILIGSILAVLLVALAAGLTRAQGPEPPGEGVGPQGASIAAVGSYIPIQGRLTDASGNPLNGTFNNVSLRIYETGSGGTPLCQVTPPSLNVSNGLFSTYIPCSSGVINGRQLYLAVKVGDDGEMTPRQPIYPVPYAFSLKPGALISDTMSGAILSVRNYGSGTGVYGYSSNGVAISAEGTGIIKSTARSYLWISGNGLQKAKSTDVTVFEYDLYGGYLVKPGSDLTNKTVVLPVTIPGQLYGQNVTVTGLDLYYKTSDDTTGITVSAMRRQNGAGAGDQIFWDGTFHSCPPPAACTQHWDLSTNNVLSDQRGILYIAFQLGFGGASSSVQIGGARLTLEHD